MAIRRLSPKTQYQYIRHVKRFADFVGRSVDKATTEDVHRYQLWLASIGTTVPTVNVSATALRFFFKVTLKRRDLAEAVVSVREPRRLPRCSQPGRGQSASCVNDEHQAQGPEPDLCHRPAVAEAHRQRQNGSSGSSWARASLAKAGGKKDRYVILSPNLLKLLRDLWHVARKTRWMAPGQPWLFPGYRGQHISARQLHRLVRLAAARAGITKRVGVHTLRDSFATHLLEQKTDMRIIRSLPLRRRGFCSDTRSSTRRAHIGLARSPTRRRLGDQRCEPPTPHLSDRSDDRCRLPINRRCSSVHIAVHHHG